MRTKRSFGGLRAPQIGRAILGAALIGVAPLAVPSPAGAAPVTFSYVGPAVPIPDAGDVTGLNPGAPATAVIPVAGLQNSIVDVNFRIDGSSCSATAGSTTVGIDHTFVDDLKITLTSPGGTTVTLIDRVDGSGNNLCQTVLDDDIGSPSILNVIGSQAPFTGTFTPASPLSAFDGQDPNGNWTVAVQDFASTDTGHLRAVSVIIDAIKVVNPALCDAAPPVGAIVGTVDNDTITGTSGDDVIFALGGSDRILPSAGDDIVCGGEGVDWLEGGDGNDVLIGGPGSDFLDGGENDDVLYGQGEVDRLEGRGGNDAMFGGDGNDRLDGGIGSNTADGGPGFNQCLNATPTNCI